MKRTDLLLSILLVAATAIAYVPLSINPHVRLLINPARATWG